MILFIIGLICGALLTSYYCTKKLRKTYNDFLVEENKIKKEYLKLLKQNL